jgi:hypothetical protein
MRSRVGIAVAGERLRAVVVRGGRVTAATEAALEPGDTLAGAVAELLAGAPIPRLPRPRLVVALGPSLAQTRRLTGLPPLRDARLVAQLVREGAGKFFLRNGRPLVTTGARLEEPGTAWCAALDADTVRQAAAGARQAGLRVDAFVPAVAALAYAGDDGRVRWSDGAAVAEAEFAAGALVSVRRLAAAPAEEGDGEARELAAALGEIGARAHEFADAYGAAVLPDAEALAHRPGRAAAGRVPGWRLGVAGAAAALALAAVLVLPPLRARRAADAAALRLEAAAPRLRAAEQAGAGLARATGALDEVARFGETRWSPTRLLAELAGRLPAGTALVSFRADTASGSLVALAPRATAVLAALERVEGVGRVEIAGPVTREGAAGREVERVTLRFAFDPRARAAADAAGGEP